MPDHPPRRNIQRAAAKRHCASRPVIDIVGRFSCSCNSHCWQTKSARFMHKRHYGALVVGSLSPHPQGRESSPWRADVPAEFVGRSLPGGPTALHWPPTTFARGVVPRCCSQLVGRRSSPRYHNEVADLTLPGNPLLTTTTTICSVALRNAWSAKKVKHTRTKVVNEKQPRVAKQRNNREPPPKSRKCTCQCNPRYPKQNCSVVAPFTMHTL